MASSDGEKVKESVKDYYGKQLKTTDDLKTNACVTSSCAFNKVPPNVRAALKLCHEEVVKKYYGCGLVFPECLEGSHVLDLGSGSGRDCYVLSKLVGEDGFVTGVDMTQEQLDVANKYVGYHTKEFGYAKPNTEFKMGDIENLAAAGILDSSTDIVVSNCVVNLASDKKAVLAETWRALKVGGEVYFSDVYADRIMSDEIRKHELLWGECIAGALWWKQLVDLCKEIGFTGPYLVTCHKITVGSEELSKVLGDAELVSATYRLFKTTRKDESEEVFTATYKGTMQECPDEFKFDIFTKFKVNEPHPIPATMAEILRSSRYSKHFEVSTTSSRPSMLRRDAYMTADPFAGINILSVLSAKKSEGSECCAAPKESEASCCAGSKKSEGSDCCSASKESEASCCSASKKNKESCCSPQKKCC